jgi:ADP-ribose pyrophosphatase
MNEAIPEKVISSREIYRGRIVTLRVDEIRLPSGRTTTREIVEHPGAVVIVAVDSRDRVILVRQYRAAIAQTTLELPAGTREPNEAAERCAQRELAEETGLSAQTWHPLVGFYSTPGFTNEHLSVFVATDLGPAEGHPEEDESIQHEWVDLAAVPGMISKGEICDAKTIAGLLCYLQGIRATRGV